MKKAPLSIKIYKKPYSIMNNQGKRKIHKQCTGWVPLIKEVSMVNPINTFKYGKNHVN